MKNWKEYFVDLTLVVASKSKDPSRKVGCVIVGPDKEIRSTGFNGFPRGVVEDVSVPAQAHFPKEFEWNITTRKVDVLCGCGKVLEIEQEDWERGNQDEHFTGPPMAPEVILNERWERPIKYQYVEHAERNAIYNAARVGTPTLGCSAFVSLAPCVGCSRALVQAGIVEVYGPAFEEEQNDIYHFDISQRILQEGGVNYVVTDYAPKDTA